MAKIVESPYYFSVHSDNLLEEEKYNFYGLLNIKQNRFYILHRNHSLLKFLQIVLIKNFYGYSMVGFKYFNIDVHKKIDNHDCNEWGGTHNMITNLELETNVSGGHAKLVKEELSRITPSDFELQEKMFFMMDILTNLDGFFKKIRYYETDVMKPMRDGYDELKKYLEIICPNDKNIFDFIDKECKQLQIKSLTLDTYWNKLLLFFYNVDLRKNSIESLLDLLKKHMQQPEFELEQFKRMYQHPHNAFEELCRIVGFTAKD